MKDKDYKTYNIESFEQLGMFDPFDDTINLRKFKKLNGPEDWAYEYDRYEPKF